MNCETVRHALLSAERPEPPPIEVRPHLTDCLDCRAWLRRFGAMERQLSLLPVPPSSSKERLLRKLREVGRDRPAVPSQHVPLPARIKARGLKKLAVAFSLAATVAAFAVGLWSWPTRDQVQTSKAELALLGRFERKRTQVLAEAARNPGESVKGLARLSGEVQQEAAKLAQRAAKKELLILAHYYEQVVRDELVKMAQNVPASERRAVFEEARLVFGRADSEMERLAVELEASAEPLRLIAKAAREGDKRLRALLEAEGA